MPMSLQKRHIAAELRRRGIEADIVDIDMWTDDTLDYGENLRAVLSVVGQGSRRRRDLGPRQRAREESAFMLGAPKKPAAGCPIVGKYQVSSYTRKCPRTRRRK